MSTGETRSEPRIGCMLGDVTGVGPEITVKLLASGKTDSAAEVIIIGDRRVLELGMRDAGITVPYTAYQSLSDYRRGTFSASRLCTDQPRQCRSGLLSAGRSE